MAHRTDRHSPSLARLAARIADLLRDAGRTRPARPSQHASIEHHRSKLTPKRAPRR